MFVRGCGCARVRARVEFFLCGAGQVVDILHRAFVVGAAGKYGESTAQNQKYFHSWREHFTHMSGHAYSRMHVHPD